MTKEKIRERILELQSRKEGETSFARGYWLILMDVIAVHHGGRKIDTSEITQRVKWFRKTFKEEFQRFTEFLVKPGSAALVDAWYDDLKKGELREPFAEKLKDGEFEVGDLVSVKMLPQKGKVFEVRSRRWATDLKQYEYVIGSTSGSGKTMVLRSVWLEKALAKPLTFS